MSDVITVIVILLLIAGAWFGYKRHKRPKPLDKSYFVSKWKDLQKLLADKKQWVEAIVRADNLLDEALKKLKLGGKSTGERLVKAQNLFTDNDAVWYGHKLRTKIDTDEKFKPKEANVKQALLGIRQALKDIGALPGDQQRKR